MLVTGKCTVKNKSEADQMKASFLGIELANIHYDENMSISARSGITITKLTPMIRFVKYRQKTRQNRKQENETAIKEEIQEDLVGTHEETEKEHLYSFTRFRKASQM